MTACAIAIGVLVGSSLLALFCGRRGRAPSTIAAIGAVVAAALALPPAIASLAGAAPDDLVVAWAAPLGDVRFGIDPLSAFFIVPLMTLGPLCAIYGGFYLDDQRARRWLAAPACAYNLLLAAMLTVLVARDGIVLVIAWELMTLASFVLVVFDHAEPEVRRAGWVYLIASHIGVACILSMFMLLGHVGGYDFTSLAAPHSAGIATVAAVLGLVGFGVKAGIVPLHVWLPEAHAAAPSHVSALMSAVLIKLGIYGVLRTITFVGPALPWGTLLIALGTVGALVGIGLAFYQRDFKRALAYSSVENIGVVLIGLGIGLWGVENAHPIVAALGLCGGLFHIWNHAVMKGLMFLGAGSLLHGAGTRDIGQMGGLMKRMPQTGALLVIGTVAIAAVPPLNGFASEWLMYLGLARVGTETATGGGLWMIFAVAALAAVGVIAVLCFVRLIGLGLLGQPRSAAAEHAHESGRGLVYPMVVLAVALVALPFALPLLVTALEPVIHELTGRAYALGAAGDALTPITILSGAIWVLAIAAFLVVRRLSRTRRTTETWGCGYTVPSARMQYTGASFAEGLNRLLPRVMRERIVVQPSQDLFPSPGKLSADREDPFTRAAYEPFVDRFARRAGQLRWMQAGFLHIYVLFIVAAILVAITVVSIRDWWVLP
jgi:hydrogenase-4 component B